MGEECLVVNVWTPNLDDGKRPVLVWLHGSPFNLGTGSGREAANLARRGDVVVVTLNHRLGVLGFLYLEQLVPNRYAGSGVVGMLDIVAALAWVRANIGGFGGDPANVTVSGCSGGGMKTSTLLAMPGAEGLFHKAIVESGPYVRGVDAGRATQFAERFLWELGVKAEDAADLDEAPVGRLIEAQEKVLRDVAADASGAGGVEQDRLKKFLVGVAHGGPLWDIGPVVDGVALPRHPFDPVAPQYSASVPLVIGNNKDESSMWMMMYPSNDVTLADVEAIAAAIRGEKGRDVVALYRRTRPSAGPEDLLDPLISTDAMWLDSVHIAERKAVSGPAPVFMYQFAYESDALDGRLKAGHGMEVAFVFNDVEANRATGTRPERVDVARAMSDAWVAFARQGDPNHPGLPKWTPYMPDDRTTMVFDSPCRVAPDPTELRQGLDALGIEFAKRT